MSFAYYNIGRSVPSPKLLTLAMPAAPSDVLALRESLENVRDFGTSARKVAEATRLLANLASGNKGAGLFGYHKSAIAGTEIGVDEPWVATPNFLGSELLRLSAETKSVNNDIVSAIYAAGDGSAKQLRLQRFAKNSWLPFLKNVTQLVDTHQKWHERLWGALYTEIQLTRTQLIGFRKIAKELGAEITSPEPEIPEKTDGVFKSVTKAATDTLKTILYFVAGGVLLWLVVQFAPKLLGKGA